MAAVVGRFKVGVLVVTLFSRKVVASWLAPEVMLAFMAVMGVGMQGYEASSSQ